MFVLKKLVVVILALCALSVLCEVKIIDNREAETFAMATKTILENSVNEFRTVHLVPFSNSSVTTNLINELTKRAGSELIFYLHDIRDFLDKLPSNLQIRSFNGVILFMLDSVADIRTNVPNFIISNVLKLFYITYIHEASLEDIIRNIDAWEHYAIPKLHFMVNTNKHFYDLVVIEKFSETKCDVLQSRIINRYLKQKMAWEKPMTRLTRDVDHHNCEVCFSIRSNLEGGVVRKTETGIELSGAVMELMKELSKSLRFKIRFCLVDNQTDSNCTLLNIKPVVHSSTQTIQVSIFPNDLVFVIPEGEPYSDWEILLLAFDESTWHYRHEVLCNNNCSEFCVWKKRHNACAQRSHRFLRFGANYSTNTKLREVSADAFHHLEFDHQDLLSRKAV